MFQNQQVELLYTQNNSPTFSVMSDVTSIKITFQKYTQQNQLTSHLKKNKENGKPYPLPTTPDIH